VPVAGRDLPRRLVEDPRDPPCLLRPRAACPHQRRLQPTPCPVQLLRGLGVDIGHAAERLAHRLHPRPDPSQQLQDRVGLLAMQPQMRLPGLGDRVELAIAFGGRGGEAGLVEIGERRIHHARTRCVEAAGALLQLADQFVAMRRTRIEQREQQQLQLRAAELAAAEPLAAEAAPEPTATLAEPAPKPAPPLASTALCVAPLAVATAATTSGIVTALAAHAPGAMPPPVAAAQVAFLVLRLGQRIEMPPRPAQQRLPELMMIVSH